MKTVMHAFCHWAALLGLAVLLQTQAPVRAQAAPAATGSDTLVLIGHANVPALDIATAQRLYTGRAVEVGGVAVSVVNLPPSNRLRERFLTGLMASDEGRYVAYWTVRRHIGKGAPPPELKTAAAVIDHVTQTPGGVGYVSVADLKPGLNVVLRP